MKVSEINQNRAIESIVEQFESQWSSDFPPESLLELLPSDTNLASLIFEELACTDLELRLKSGIYVPVESYINLFPGVQRSSWIDEMVIAEFELRARYQPHRPKLSEYKWRFPGSYRQLIQSIELDETELVSNKSSTFETRFEKHRLHKNGGLGTIWLAYDRQLDRHVALKEIRNDFRNQAGIRARFEREAQVTSRLDHPGVVPVYSIGQTEKGRPYYAMKFVDGNTLSHRINQFYLGDATSVHSNNAQHQSEFNRLLRHFVDVCNAVHFAHKLGVIHRDIKPQNVMIGAHGETLLVDWGLAKVTDPAFWNERKPFDLKSEVQEQGELPFAESEIETDAKKVDTGVEANFAAVGVATNGFNHSKSNDIPSSSELSEENFDSCLTLSGTQIGSPGYMSPEQESGQQELVGPKSDIYSLGVMLKTILTNELDASDGLVFVPICKPVLDSIVKKATSKDPELRYTDALQLAVDVEKYLAGEKTLAHSESIVEGISRFVRKHRRWVIPGVSALLVISLAIALSTVFINKFRTNSIVSKKQSLTAVRQSEDWLELLKKVFKNPEAIYTPVAASLNSRIPELLDDIDEIPDPLQRAQLYDVLGQARLVSGMYNQALELTLEAQRLGLESEPLDKTFYCGTLVQLSDVYGSAGYYHDSLDYARRASEFAKSELGESNLIYVDSLAQITSVHRKLGENRDALAAAKEMMTRIQERNPNDHRSVVRALNAMVAIALDSRDPKTAANIQKRIEQLWSQEKLQDKWVRTTVDLNQAVILQYHNKHEAVVQLLKNVLDQRIALVRVNHPDVHSVIRMLTELQSIDEMMELINKYQSWGDHSPATYLLQLGLAKAYVKAQRALEAVQVLEDAIEKCQSSSLEKDNLMAAELMTALGKLMLECKDDDEMVEKGTTTLLAAEEIYDRLHNPQTDVLYNRRHVELLITIARALTKNKQFESARQYYNRTWELQSKMYGEFHRKPALRMIGIGKCEFECDKFFDSKEHLSRAFDVLGKCFEHRLAKGDAKTKGIDAYMHYYAGVELMKTLVAIGNFEEVSSIADSINEGVVGARNKSIRKQDFLSYACLSYAETGQADQLNDCSRMLIELVSQDGDSENGVSEATARLFRAENELKKGNLEQAASILDGFEFSNHYQTTGIVQSLETRLQVMRKAIDRYTRAEVERTEGDEQWSEIVSSYERLYDLMRSDKTVLLMERFSIERLARIIADLATNANCDEESEQWNELADNGRLATLDCLAKHGIRIPTN